MVRRRWLFVALAAAVASACLSPTLPLPPPTRPDEIGTPDESGQVRLRGTVLPHAEVFARNQRTGQIAGELTGSTGRYDFFVGGQIGDELVLWYVLDTDTSPSIIVSVPAR
ncbi:MAG: hypothetical protein IT376_21445 [Polyangiaceae bacterium]|nr:hypothetical protein [Polyangiaceae bacterium]